MRILLVNDYATPGGGAEYQMLSIREGLRRRGHQVRLFSSDAPLVSEDPVVADLTANGRSDLGQVISQTVNLSAWRALRRELRNYPPDIVHIRMFLWQLSPLILQPLASVPVLFQAAVYKAICPTGLRLLPDGTECHHPAGLACLKERCVRPPTWLSTMAQLRLLALWRDRIDRVAVLSEKMRREFEANGWSSSVLGNGVDLPPKTASPGAVQTIGFAGRLTREKGVDVLLDAFAGVLNSHPKARMLIAGTGPEESRLRSQAAALHGQVEFLGHLSRDSLDAALRGIWVQAVPSLWHEPFGNVSTEAMARGTAVVASDVGGQPEIVRDGVSGYIVPPNDPKALAAALTDLLSDRERAARFGAEGRRIAAAEYSWDAVLDRLEESYRATVETFLSESDRKRDG